MSLVEYPTEFPCSWPLGLLSISWGSGTCTRFGPTHHLPRPRFSFPRARGQKYRKLWWQWIQHDGNKSTALVEAMNVKQIMQSPGTGFRLGLRPEGHVERRGSGQYESDVHANVETQQNCKCLQVCLDWRKIWQFVAHRPAASLKRMKERG